MNITSEAYFNNLFTLKPPVDVAVLLFVGANFISYMLAEDRGDAFFGFNSRYQGFLIIILYALTYYIISRLHTYEAWLFPGFLLICTIIYGIAVLQHFNLDFIGFYEELSDASRKKFLTTLGNINVVSQFCSFTLVGSIVFFCEFLKGWKRTLVGVLPIMLGSMALICANSDSGIVAFFVTMLLLAIWMIKKEKTIVPWVASVGIVLFSWGLLGVMQIIWSGAAVSFVGLSRLANRPIVLLISAVICALVVFVQDKLAFILKNKVVIYGCIGMVVILSLFILSVFSPEVFRFDDQWGTNRGFVWKRLWNMFWNFPLIQILFGAGQGSIVTYMKEFYGPEMAEIGYVYDSAHNEYLQYLFTTGVVGLASYVYLIVCVLKKGILNRTNNSWSSVVFWMLICYLILAFFNISQPIVSPYFFILASWLVAECSNCYIRMNFESDCKK